MRTPSSSAQPLTLCEVLLEEAAAMTDGTIRTRTESHVGTEAELQSLRENRAEIQKTMDEMRSASPDSREADTWQERKQVFDLLHKLDRAALCFSGGGIRSATFGLGILQGLAQHSKREDGILPSLDFISTVSGGGYLGGWLTRWREEVKS